MKKGIRILMKINNIEIKGLKNNDFFYLCIFKKIMHQFIWITSKAFNNEINAPAKPKQTTKKPNRIINIFFYISNFWLQAIYNTIGKIVPMVTPSVPEIKDIIQITLGKTTAIDVVISNKIKDTITLLTVLLNFT